MFPMTPRIAVVQHGDVREARRLRAAGEPEPYYGMHYSQGFLDRWMAGRPHLVVSLNAPAYREDRGESVAVGLPERVRQGVPRTLTQYLWAKRISRELRRFQPTHFLLRTGSLLAAMLLRTAIRQRWNTLAMFAGFFPNDRPYDRFVTRRIVRRLNDPLVFAAGNHRRPAADSMTDAGLDPAKAIPWDYPLVRDPKDFPFKTLTGGPVEVIYAGSMVVNKGVGDVIDAVRLLRTEGRDVRLTLCGDGPDLPRFRDQSAELGAAAMCRKTSSLPTRHEFPEGFPLTMTEAFTAHTPVVASDHPVFTRVLKDGEGLRYFPAGDAAALARTLIAVCGDANAFDHLSRETATAFDRLQCPVRFHEVIERWLPTA
ncbi:MAG TPA: glycosyltransferase family 4 protein [Gemmataceae bacterium]|nr:glycosyltransferase family 4 protein [Gemmataceae bacterium]